MRIERRLLTHGFRVYGQTRKFLRLDSSCPAHWNTGLPPKEKYPDPAAVPRLPDSVFHPVKSEEREKDDAHVGTFAAMEHNWSDAPGLS